MSARNGTIRFLCHVHSRASFDSVMSVRSIVRFCAKHSVSILAISDHNVFCDWQEARRLAQHEGVALIRSIEYTTDAGDIIGLFVNETISSRNCCEVIDSIRSSGALVLLPHPMKGHYLEKIPLDRVDLIETFNSRCTPEQNRKSEQLAKKLGKAALVSSDAHFIWELGNAINVFNDVPSYVCDSEQHLKNLLLYGRRIFETRTALAVWEDFSQLVKGIRQRQPRLVAGSGFAIFVGMVNSLLGRRVIQQAK